MNKDEAHHLLNKRKQGFAVPLYLVNSALVVSGDISMACSPCQATRVESTGMAQGQGTGVMPYGSVEWDNRRLNQHHESPQ
jgi:hypothetical protein